MHLESTIKCPQCGFEKQETMPTDACQISYECPNCKTLLKPKQGDCCVFCSYGSVKCPPKQKEDCVINNNEPRSNPSRTMNIIWQHICNLFHSARYLRQL